MQFFGCPYTCKRKLSIIGQLFSLQTSTMSLNPTDYVKQFSGLARIRVTENREESSTIEMSVTLRGLGFHSLDETKWSLTFILPLKTD